MSDFKKLFGLRLKELRKEKGFSQEKFAEILGIAVRNLSKIETGETFPNSVNLEKIIITLNVSPKELFSFQHLKNHDILVEELIFKLKNNPEKIKDLYKIIKELFY